MTGDRFTVRAIALGLLAIALVVVLGSLYLVNNGRAIPDSLIAIGSAALGGASTFLVSTRSGGEPPAEVQVMNEPGDPVPTVEKSKK